MYTQNLQHCKTHKYENIMMGTKMNVVCNQAYE